jgi:hypothetical protein
MQSRLHLSVTEVRFTSLRSTMQRALRDTLGEPQPTTVPLPQPPAAEWDMAMIPDGINLYPGRASAGAAAADIAQKTEFVPMPTRLPVVSRPVAAPA